MSSTLNLDFPLGGFSILSRTNNLLEQIYSAVKTLIRFRERWRSIFGYFCSLFVVHSQLWTPHKPQNYLKNRLTIISRPNGKSRLKAGLLALCTMLLFASCHVRAELVPIPALQNRVTDLTQTLTVEQQNLLEAKLAAFEQQKGSQIAVLIVPTTQPEVIEQYSIRVVDAWKLGREKPDDGLLLLVAKDDRKMRIEVGRGLEGAIPDLIAKRVITEVMAPHFKQGDFYGGINDAIDKLIGLVSGEQLPAPASSGTDAKNFGNLLPLLFFGGLMLGGVLRSIFGDFLGGALNGGAIGMLAWLLGGGILAAILFGIVAFILTLIGPSNFGHMGGFGGGSGYGGGHDTFSGGGGSFGGGGASGDW